MAYTKSNYAMLGIEVVSSSIDPDTNGGVVVAMNDMFGVLFISFRRLP